MKIAIYGQFYQKNSETPVQKLLDFLHTKNVNVFIDHDFYKEIEISNELESYSEFSTFNSLDASFDILISIGGDGTMLRASALVKDLGIPIVGINTGRLGFLATIQNHDIENSINQILQGKYKISNRSLLTIKTTPENPNLLEQNFALNEIAVSRKNTTSMITVETRLNDEYLTSYWSDGLIISTPTGSTGYSLSCGGPVLTPDTDSFILTPIAPHNLSARPLVIKDSTKIQLRVSGREDTYLVSLDSRIATLPNEAVITIEKAPFKVKMIELYHESFLDTLRKKLLWGEDKRN